MPYEEDKMLHDVTPPPHKAYTGEINPTLHEELKTFTEYQSKIIVQLRNELEDLKNDKTSVEPEEETKEYLNLMIDVKRLDKCARRLDKHMRTTKDKDVAVRCGNAIALISGKKLVLIQSLTHIKK